MIKKAVFLDRDGVINRDSANYIKSWSEFVFIPGSIDAIKRLHQNDFTIFVITNQSIINRQMVSEETLDDIHSRMKTVIRKGGGYIREIFYCPHTPEENCACRKPKSGLIDRAKEAYGIELSSAIMVGDNVKDIECAQNAGCRFSVLVQTGCGMDAEKILKENNNLPDYIAQDLDAASRWIINTYDAIIDPTS